MRISYPQFIPKVCDTPIIKRNYCATLDKSLRFDARREPPWRFSSRRTTKLLGAVIALTAIMNPAVASYAPEKEIYQIYTHSRLMNTKEFLCVYRLWNKESNWNPKSRNKVSSAYGIPQLLKLKTNDPFKQIDAGLAYIAHRYETPCNAWKHWKHKKKTNGVGWY